MRAFCFVPWPPLTRGESENWVSFPKGGENEGWWAIRMSAHLSIPPIFPSFWNFRGIRPWQPLFSRNYSGEEEAGPHCALSGWLWAMGRSQWEWMKTCWQQGSREDESSGVVWNLLESCGKVKDHGQTLYPTFENCLWSCFWHLSSTLYPHVPDSLF